MFGYSADMSWDDYEAEMHRLRTDLDAKTKLKSEASATLWIELVTVCDLIAFQMRSLKQIKGPRPSPTLEPEALYRAIQGRQGWGYWFDRNGLQVRSTLRKNGSTDAPMVEVHLASEFTDDQQPKIISCWHDHGYSSRPSWFWWLIEPTESEKVRISQYWFKCL